MTPPTCTHCNRTTKVIFVACKPESSEYYCDNCHKSQRIDPQELGFWHQRHLQGIKS